jgi:hypothetical protein
VCRPAQCNQHTGRSHTRIFEQHHPAGKRSLTPPKRAPVPHEVSGENARELTQHKSNVQSKRGLVNRGYYEEEKLRCRRIWARQGSLRGWLCGAPSVRRYSL